MRDHVFNGRSPDTIMSVLAPGGKAMRGSLKSLVIVIAALSFMGLVVSPVLAESDYPNRPVRLIVGFIAGSSADITARVLGSKMSQILGQQIVVESKPGAGSNLAAEFVARAPKDGT